MAFLSFVESVVGYLSRLFINILKVIYKDDPLQGMHKNLDSIIYLFIYVFIV